MSSSIYQVFVNLKMVQLAKLGCRKFPIFEICNRHLGKCSKIQRIINRKARLR
jgi:hypothetical protein